jgi:hypothetical protein
VIEQRPSLDAEQRTYVWRMLSAYGQHCDTCPRAEHGVYGRQFKERGDCDCGYDALLVDLAAPAPAARRAGSEG